MEAADEIERLTRELSDKEAEVGRLMEEINTGRCSHCGAAIPTCDTAFQQGAEAAREYAATTIELQYVAMSSTFPLCGDTLDHCVGVIRSMELPERGEG